MQALKGVVILMTLTIAVLMTLIVYGMYQKSQDPNFKFFDLSGGDTSSIHQQSPAGAASPPQQAASVPAAAAFGDITLPLPAGAHIASATVSGNRLIVITTAPEGEQVWVVDLATGKLLGRVQAQKAP